MSNCKVKQHHNGVVFEAELDGSYVLVYENGTLIGMATWDGIRLTDYVFPQVVKKRFQEAFALQPLKDSG